MARKGRSKRSNKAQKKIPINATKEDTIAKLNSLTDKAKLQRKTENFGTLKSSRPKYFGIAIVVIIFTGLIGYVSFFNTGITGNTGNGGDGGGDLPGTANYLICEHSESQDHYHFTLNIYIDGQINPIPSDMGLSPCVRPIHTHTGDPQGYIHIELPASITQHPRIIDIFKVYSDTYPSASISSDSLMGVKGNITATVDGIDVENFLDYIPNNNEIIKLSLTPY